MKFRTDFVTNSSSSCFVLSRKSITEGLEKYPLPVDVPKEGALPVETVYRLLWELYDSFVEPCEQILKDFPFTQEEIKESFLRDYSYPDMKEMDEADALMVLEDLITEKVEQTGQGQHFKEKYGVKPGCDLWRLLEKIRFFQRGWRKYDTYAQVRAEKLRGDDELPFDLLDYTKGERDCFDGNFPTFFGTPCDRCRFGKSGCKYPEPLCYGDVGVDSWDGEMPYVITEVLMRYCVCGGNHLW